MAFKSDEILWYNPQGTVWGDLGYAVPNYGDDPTTINDTIAYLTEVVGRNLSGVMHSADARLRTPPTINTLIKIHKLIIRARSILASRAVPDGQQRFEAQHATPAQRPFIIFPVPFWKTRNTFLKEYCGLTLQALGEAFQHTENAIQHDISTQFAGLFGQYLQRIYIRMATELFGKTIDDAKKPDFTLTDDDLKAYSPAKFFTSTEMIDTVPNVQLIPTEDDLQVLTDGIPANVLVGVGRYPLGAVSFGQAQQPATNQGQPATIQTTANAAFAPPPGP